MRQAIPAQISDRWIQTVSECVSAAGIMDEEVEAGLLKTFTNLPRSSFVEGCDLELLETDVDLPIGFDQWLTRPSIQIRMLGLIQLRKKMRVLELGFGSGYLCAAMELAGAHVFGVEQIGLLAQRTRKTLDRLGHHGVVVRRGEGQKGWLESGPYDAIIVSYPITSEAELPFAHLRRGGVLVGALSDPQLPSFSSQLCLWTRAGTTMRRVAFEEVELR